MSLAVSHEAGISYFIARRGVEMGVLASGLKLLSSTASQGAAI